MNSRQAHQAYLRSKRADVPRLSKAEEQRLEREEQERIRGEQAQIQARARAAAARDRKRAREEEDRRERKRKGLPAVAPRASQHTISWFARKPTGIANRGLEALVEEGGEEEQTSLSKQSDKLEQNRSDINTEARQEDNPVVRPQGILETVDPNNQDLERRRRNTTDDCGTHNDIQNTLGLSTQDLEHDLEELFSTQFAPEISEVNVEPAAVDEPAQKRISSKPTSSHKPSPIAEPNVDIGATFDLGFLSTQDLEITSDDLLEIGVSSHPRVEARNTPSIPNVNPEPSSIQPGVSIYTEAATRKDAIATDIPLLSTQDLDLLSDDLPISGSTDVNSRAYIQHSQAHFPTKQATPAPEPPETPRTASPPKPPPSSSPPAEEPQPFFTASGSNELLSLAILRSRREAEIEKYAWRPTKPKPREPQQPKKPVPGKENRAPGLGGENDVLRPGKEKIDATPVVAPRKRTQMARVKSDLYDHEFWNGLDDDDWGILDTPAKT